MKIDIFYLYNLSEKNYLKKIGIGDWELGPTPNPILPKAYSYLKILILL